MSARDPRYPSPWDETVPLAILGEVEGRNPYDSARHVPNYRLTPAHPDLDDTQNIVLAHVNRRRS